MLSKMPHKEKIILMNCQNDGLIEMLDLASQAMIITTIAIMIRIIARIRIVREEGAYFLNRLLSLMCRVRFRGEWRPDIACWVTMNELPIADTGLGWLGMGLSLNSFVVFPSFSVMLIG